MTTNFPSLTALVAGSKDFLKRLRRSIRHRHAGDVEPPRKIRWIWISLRPRQETIMVRGQFETRWVWPRKGDTLNKGRNAAKRHARAERAKLRAQAVA